MEELIELTEKMVVRRRRWQGAVLRGLLSILTLIPAVIFLLLWMVILSVWLAPHIDRVVASVNEAACAYKLTTQCPPPCEYRSQRGCVPKKAKF